MAKRNSKSAGDAGAGEAPAEAGSLEITPGASPNLTGLPNKSRSASGQGKGTGKAARDARDAGPSPESQSVQGQEAVDTTARNYDGVKTRKSQARLDGPSLGTSPGVAMIKFRAYQQPVFIDRQSGILILHWSRQIGKSFTLASWAVDRLLSQLQKYDSWLITVLSNSRDNGAEFNLKCAEVCTKMGLAMVREDSSPDLEYQNMRMEVRITLNVGGRERVGRIKVLAANPRTARGFSGDLILDEFAYHENSAAIWEAAEPILSANSEFLCRIASTGNGKHNMFYRMSAGDGPNDGAVFLSASGFKVSRVTRSQAHRMGVKVYDPNTRKPITPEQARAKSLDKRAYDQNYECKFNDENMTLLTHELISSAEREGIVIDEQFWSPASVARMFRAEGDLYVGNDIGRNRDLSVVSVLEKIGQKKRVIGMLRMSGMRLPAQQDQVDIVCKLPKFRAYEGDMTGLGMGLVEYLQEKFGTYRIRGVNFASTEPLADSRAAKAIKESGRKAETARVTELMATEMLAVFEERSIEIPQDQELRDDLAKPEKITTPGGKVSIAATRDEAGHADHFWSLALALRACAGSAGPAQYTRVAPPQPTVGSMGLGKYKGAVLL